MVKGIQHIATTESGGVPLGSMEVGQEFPSYGASSSRHNVISWGPHGLLTSAYLSARLIILLSRL